MALALESVHVGQLPGKPARAPAVSAVRKGGPGASTPPPGGAPKTAPTSLSSTVASATSAQRSSSPVVSRPPAGLAFAAPAGGRDAKRRRPSRKAPPSVGGGRFDSSEFGDAHEAQLRKQQAGSLAQFPPLAPRTAAAHGGGGGHPSGQGGSPGSQTPTPQQLPPPRPATLSAPAPGVPSATPPSMSDARPPQESIPPAKRKSRRPSIQMPALGTAKPAEGRRVRRSSGYGRSSIKRSASVGPGGSEASLSDQPSGTSPQHVTPHDPSGPIMGGASPGENAQDASEGSRGDQPAVQLMEAPPPGRRKHPLGAPSVTSVRSRGPLEGYDFSSGVSMAGTLAIQAPHGNFKWWLKHFVLSESEQALFFWTGGPDEATSLAKRIMMSTVSKIAREADRRKEGSRMFVLGVTSGATLRLAAGTPREAQLWVAALHQACRSHVAVTSISRVFRGWTGRRMLLLVAGSMKANQAAAAGNGGGDTPSTKSPGRRPHRAGTADLPGSPVATRRRSESASSMAPLLMAAGHPPSPSRGGGPARAASYTLHPDVALVGPSAPFLVQSWAQRISVSTLSAAAHRIGCAGALATYLFDAVVPPSRRASTGGGRAIAMRQAWAALHDDSDMEPPGVSSPPAAAAEPPSMNGTVTRAPGHSTTPAGKPGGGGAKSPTAASPTEGSDEGTFIMTNSMQQRGMSPAGASSPPPAGLSIRAPLHMSDDDSDADGAGGDSARGGVDEEDGTPSSDHDALDGEQADDDADEEEVEGGSEDGEDPPPAIVDAWGMWYTQHSDDSDTWYVSEYTGEAEWEAPENTVGTAEYPWETANDEDGDTFYLNRAVAALRVEQAEGTADEDAVAWTEHIPESQWEEPPGWGQHAVLLEQHAVESAQAGEYEWYCVEDEDGDVFYVHIPTGNTQWDEPPGWDAHVAYQAEHGEGTGLVEVSSDAEEEEEGGEDEEEEGGSAGDASDAADA